MHKELHLWLLFSFEFYAQRFLDVVIRAMKTVSLTASAIDRYDVQIKVNKLNCLVLIINSMLITQHRNKELDIDQQEEQVSTRFGLKNALFLICHEGLILSNHILILVQMLHQI